MVVMMVIVGMMFVRQRAADLRQSILQPGVGLIHQAGGVQERFPRRAGLLGPLSERVGVLAVVLDPVGQQHP